MLSIVPVDRGRPNGGRVSCGALKKDSLLNLRARQLQALVRQPLTQTT